MCRQSQRIGGTPVFPSITACELVGHVYSGGITFAWVIAHKTFPVLQQMNPEKELIMSVQMKHKHALPAIHVVKQGPLIIPGGSRSQQEAVGKQPPICGHLDNSVCSTAEANLSKKPWENA